MTTLQETLQDLEREPLGCVLLEDNAGGEWFPRDLLEDLRRNDEGKFQLARAVVRVERAEGDLDSVIAFVSQDGYEYPHEPRWYVIRPSAQR